jgi:pyruvate/2-oxoglutarate dehydrogenase complex dihydrolipoamide acyltransferase (E2) component
MEWEATDDGILQKIYVEEGGKVNVGDRIAFIGEEGEEAPDGAEKIGVEEGLEKEEPKSETKKPVRPQRSNPRPPRRRKKLRPRKRPRKEPEPAPEEESEPLGSKRPRSRANCRRKRN